MFLSLDVHVLVERDERACISEEDESFSGVRIEMRGIRDLKLSEVRLMCDSFEVDAFIESCHVSL